tara:strand:+ start:1988 stop:2116 length:129 start_codon:yes stop_codon:yes gene_type:complete
LKKKGIHKIPKGKSKSNLTEEIDKKINKLDPDFLQSGSRRYK